MKAAVESSSATGFRDRPASAQPSNHRSSSQKKKKKTKGPILDLMRKLAQVNIRSAR